MRKLNPDDPNDRQIILMDLIEQEIESWDLLELLILLEKQKDRSFLNDNLLLSVDQNSITLQTYFWQQIYLDFVDQ